MNSLRAATASESWWVVRLTAWLVVLPLRLRIYSLPRLLERLTPVGRSKGCTPIEMARAVRLVVRLCHLRLFRTRLFPRTCLRQALALYYVLTHLGYPATINIGVCKQKEILHAHSWVTVWGQAVGEPVSVGIFQVIYAYPPSSLAHRETGDGAIQENNHGCRAGEHAQRRFIWTTNGIQADKP